MISVTKSTEIGAFLREYAGQALFLWHQLRKARFEALGLVLRNDVRLCRFVEGLIDCRKFRGGIFPLLSDGKFAERLHGAFISILLLDVPYAPRLRLPKRFLCG